MNCVLDMKAPLRVESVSDSSDGKSDPLHLPFLKTFEKTALLASVMYLGSTTLLGVNERGLVNI